MNARLGRRFLCTVEMQGGAIAERIVLADTAAEARTQVESADGCFLLDCRTLGDSGRFPLFGKAVPEEELLSFLRQWEVLLRAGIPVAQALAATLERKGNRAFDRFLRAVIAGIEGGRSVSESLSLFPAQFPPHFTAALSAAEKTGTIPDVLRRHVDHVGRMRELRRAVTAALLYPAILLASLAAVSLFLLLYVLPSFVQIYSDARAELPWLTVRLLAAASWAGGGGWLWVLGVLAGSAGALFGGWRSRFRPRMERALLATPKVGAILLDHLTVRFARTLSILLKGGFPLLDSLRLAMSATGNRYVAGRLARVAGEVEGGASFASALRRDGTLDPVAVRMIEAGEKSGDLPWILDEISAYSEENLRHGLKVATALLEPAMMILVGLLVAVLVVSMYLPIFRISGIAQ